MSTLYGSSAVMARDLLSRTMSRILQRPRFPESTYRLQFHAGFTFRDATAMIPFLRDLGITTLYASPYFKARPGSTHGYDIVNHNALNPELGTDADFVEFLDALRNAGMQHMLDVVPNHSAVGTNENSWWNDVLVNGPASPYARYFDIAWTGSPRPELQNKVLLPVLGEPYGITLEKGLLKLTFEEARFYIHYYDRRFPISSDSSMMVLDRASDGDIEWAVAMFNGKPGVPRSFDLLDELLNQQHYRLAYWRVASDEINYRRFFDINDLGALCMEREEVFDGSSRLLFKLLAPGHLTGVRIDHPDGLFDPKQYFDRLQRYYILATARLVFEEAPQQYMPWKQLGPALREEVDGLAEEGAKPLYVVAEKILATDEALPADWAVHGTTGYDFLNQINGLFVDGANEQVMQDIYSEITGSQVSFHGLAYEKKRLILDISLASELNMLAHQLDRLAQKDRRSRDFTLSNLHKGLREVVAAFSVYRSYVSDAGVSDTDRTLIESAIRYASERNPQMSVPLFEFILDTLLLNYPERATEQDKAEQRRFVGKFQQLTAPATAKGIEDTAFYLYHRLISLNEVGGDPDHFGVEPEELHRYLADRRAKYPCSLSCLSTHDTKRSEDMRARINVLSELPVEWREHVQLWRKLNAKHSLAYDGAPVPDANEEYLIYQTLLGVWPIGQAMSGEQRGDFVHRVQSFMEKALREGKEHSSWIEPNSEYEQRVTNFVAAIVDEQNSGEFLADFLPFQQRISHIGMLNALSQTVLRLLSPGAPDTYQGTELWDFSLVDPDNRRPVDYPHRAQLLRQLDEQLFAAGPDRSQLAASLLAAKEDSRIKLYVTTLSLRARRDLRGLFSVGEYYPIEVRGEHRERVFAFARHRGDNWALVVVPRRITALMPDPLALPTGLQCWDNTALALAGIADGLRFRNVFTGAIVERNSAGEVLVGELFAHLPVALLLSDTDSV